MPERPETPLDPVDAEDPLQTVRRVAELARLELTPEEAPRLAEEFGRILAAFGSLRDVPLETDAGEEPTVPRAQARLRPDTARTPAESEASPLDSAPERIDDFFGVPRTLGGEE